MVEFKSNITKIADYPSPDSHPTRVFECTFPPSLSMPYLSGQFAMLAHPDVRLLANPTQMKWASYSISSSPEQKGLLEFCVGEGSPTGVSHKLMTLKVGDEILVRGAFGKFTLDESAPEYIFLATGTGIAPLISMIRTLLSKNKTIPISLFFGFRHPSQHMYKEELDALQKQHSNFHVFIIASRPEPEWNYLSGHIQDHLKNFNSPNFSQTKVYICGKPEVGEELVRFCVQDMKFPALNVLIEKW